nr:uncharacterized protein LOC129036438 isoform X2 [Pongo pygmaeus]
MLTKALLPPSLRISSLPLDSSPTEAELHRASASGEMAGDALWWGEPGAGVGTGGWRGGWCSESSGRNPSSPRSCILHGFPAVCAAKRAKHRDCRQVHLVKGGAVRAKVGGPRLLVAFPAPRPAPVRALLLPLPAGFAPTRAPLLWRPAPIPARPTPRSYPCLARSPLLPLPSPRPAPTLAWPPPRSCPYTARALLHAACVLPLPAPLAHSSRLAGRDPSRAYSSSDCPGVPAQRCRAHSVPRVHQAPGQAWGDRAERRTPPRRAAGQNHRPFCSDCAQGRRRHLVLLPLLGKDNCWDEVESTQRVREDVRPDHNLPPAERRRRGFFYHPNWRFPSLDSWDLIRAAHSTQSAIDLYVARDPLSRRLRRNTRDESGTQQPKAEEQAEDKGVKPVAAELPGEGFSEQVIAVYERDSALWASGCTEDPVEEFIDESDEDAPGPSKIPTSPLPAPGEVEKTSEEAETKPSDLKDETTEEPELTCCGLTCCGRCTDAGNP